MVKKTVERSAAEPASLASLPSFVFFASLHFEDALTPNTVPMATPTMPTPPATPAHTTCELDPSPVSSLGGGFGSAGFACGSVVAVGAGFGPPYASSFSAGMRTSTVLPSPATAIVADH